MLTLMTYTDIVETSRQDGAENQEEMRGINMFDGLLRLSTTLESYTWLKESASRAERCYIILSPSHGNASGCIERR